MALNEDTMTEIKITDDKTIEEVQEAFHEHFPFLKLEFYSGEHSEGKGTLDSLKIKVDSFDFLMSYWEEKPIINTRF